MPEQTVKTQIKLLLKEQFIRNIRTCTFRHVCPAKIQTSLHIRAVWSEYSLGTFWIAKDAEFLHADNEDIDQFAQMDRLIKLSLHGGHTLEGMFYPVVTQFDLDLYC